MLLAAKVIEFERSPSQFPWCAITYHVAVQDQYQPRPIMIEVVNLADALDFKPVLWNEDFASINYVTDVRLTIDQFDTFDKARDRVIWLREEHGLPPLAEHIVVKKRGRPVRRVSDNRVYEHASDAARSNGMTPGAMSAHLKRKPGYEKVHGMVFEYV